MTSIVASTRPYASCKASDVDGSLNQNSSTIFAVLHTIFCTLTFTFAVALNIKILEAITSIDARVANVMVPDKLVTSVRPENRLWLDTN